MDSLEVAELTRAQDRREDRERDSRMRRLLIILLLLLLLLFGIVLAYLLIFSPGTDTQNKPGITMLWSVFGFDRPLSVGTDNDGRLFVSDTGNSRIVVFDSTGDHLKTIRGTKRNTRFYGVSGTHYDDKDNRLYVADFRRRKISVYNESGKRLDHFPDVPGAAKFGPRGFSPFDVTMHKNQLYVTSNNGVYVFTKKGKLVKKWSGRGGGLGQFDYPIAIEIDDEGTMYIADQLNRRVVAMTQKGVVKWALGAPDQAGKASSFFGLPRGVALDDQGQLFVSDTFHHTITVFDAKTGALKGTVANRGVEDGDLNFPEEITFRPDGVLYITDRENQRVQAWRIDDLQEPTEAQQNLYKKFFFQAEG